MTATIYAAVNPNDVAQATIVGGWSLGVLAFIATLHLVAAIGRRFDKR